MTEERITETTTPSGDTHTTHTIVTDNGTKSGGSGWMIALLLVVLAIGGFYLFSQMGGAEMAKDNAVADAASKVGDAADNVSDAAQNAGEAVEDAVAK